ncbi:competence/damage-inducible protein A [Amphibacillus jilinensis]|uniref:competence/damage-inducible protein A n=1 Tax=Amphibacillus jilinensis TaxID=1216008 RepID=UPI0003029A19|nr:competence/damage-inducible protein A [Amphibacillus jilinensis]
MKGIQAEIVAVGTELLLGQIANTNAQWISQQLAIRGISVYYHHVVGDNEKRFLEVLQSATQRSDLILITGGLGPTDDDLTRETVAQFVGKQLVESKQALADIEAYFKRSNRVMATNNRKQAHVIPGATIIPNRSGTAPGMIVPHQDCHLILMPGVPDEMKGMMEDTVFPYLEDRLTLNDVITSKMLRFIGIGESELEMKVKHLIEQQTNPTIAPLATDGEVALRLTAKAESADGANQLINVAQQQIEKVVGDYIYGVNDQTINQVIVNWLNRNQQTIAAAESLTGGRFADAMVSVPGAGHVFKGSIVSYTPDAKVAVLDIDQSILDQYGMVSEHCAYQMAKHAKNKFDATYGISFTGVAGPDELEGKDVGTVYICFYHSEDNYKIEQFSFPKNREIVRNRSVKKGLALIYQYLKKNH